MTDTVLPQPASPDPPLPSVRSALLAALPPLLLSLIATIACYVALGATTGFFFAGVVVATLVTPPLVLGAGTLFGRVLAAAAVVDGVSLGWLVAVADPFVTFGDWLRCFVLLVAYVLALSGVASALARLPVPAVVASAVVVVAFLAWLAWPVWLSPWVAGRERLVGWLSAAHPLLALDGNLRHLGPPWTERHLMYNRLSVLNQDVAYELPAVWGAVVLHALVGAVGAGAGGNPKSEARNSKQIQSTKGKAQNGVG